MRPIWVTVGVASLLINFGGAAYAFYTGEPMHAFGHGVLLVGSAVWLRYLRKSRVIEEEQALEPQKVDMLVEDLDSLQRELAETRQKLDFADQLLKQKPPETRG